LLRLPSPCFVNFGFPGWCSRFNAALPPFDFTAINLPQGKRDAIDCNRNSLVHDNAACYGYIAISVATKGDQAEALC
jgi:hypothetical protein